MKRSVENLTETYLALGATIPGTHKLFWEGGAGCTNPLPHALCNFAVASSDLESCEAEVRKMAEGKDHFTLYLTCVEPDQGVRRKLGQVGFRYAQSMLLMESSQLNPEEPFTLIREDAEGRMDASRFMVEIFFANYSCERKNRLCVATGTAEGCEIYSMRDTSARAGAVMLHQSASAVGIYNLCVHPVCRGAGVGTQIVRQVQTEAARIGLPVILQCNSQLGGWYRRLGFRNVGYLDVYAHDRFASFP